MHNMHFLESVQAFIYIEFLDIPVQFSIITSYALMLVSVHPK